MKRLTCQLLLIFTFFSSWGENRCRALDLNGDGLSDIWQAKYGITTAQANEDPDGDGFTNAQEALFGTNPFDHNDCPKINSISMAAISSYYNQVTLSWRSIEGAFYVVEVCSDLVSAHWAPVVVPPTNVPLGQVVGAAGTETSVSFSVPNFTGPRKFYRITASNTSVPAAFPSTIMNWEIGVWGTDIYTSDRDGDTIPDYYEFLTGMNPNDASDASATNSSGVTNLQAYLESMNQTQGTRAYEGFLVNESVYLMLYGSDWGVGNDNAYRFYVLPLNPSNVLDTYIAPNLWVDYYDRVTYYDRVSSEGGADRMCDHSILNNAIADYTHKFETTVAAKEIISRWQPSDPRNPSATGWIQGNYPNFNWVWALTDEYFKQSVYYITAQIATVSQNHRTFVYPIVVVDYDTVNFEGYYTDYAQYTEGSAPDTVSKVYSGSVTFDIPPGSTLPSVCTVNQGTLPSNVVQVVPFIAPGQSPSQRAAARITLTPTKPNSRRDYFTVNFETETSTNSGVFKKLRTVLPAFPADDGVERGVEYTTSTNPAQFTVPKVFSTTAVNTFPMSGELVGNQTLNFAETSIGSRIFQDPANTYTIDLSSTGTADPKDLTDITLSVSHESSTQTVSFRIGASTGTNQAYDQNPTATLVNRTPLTPDIDQDGVIYLRMPYVPDSIIEVASGNHTKTLDWMTDDNGTKNLEPFILLPPNSPSISTTIKNLMLVEGEPQVKFSLTVGGVKTPLVDMSKPRPPWLACSFSKPPFSDIMGHLNDIDLLIGKKGKGAAGPPLGADWGAGDKVECLSMANFLQGCRRHNLLYLLAHGGVRDADPIDGESWGFVGPLLYSTVQKKTEVLRPSTVSGVNQINGQPNEYFLVFFNSCAGASDPVVGRAFANSFHADHYVSWDRPAQATIDAPKAGKLFFKNLQGRITVEKACENITAASWNPVSYVLIGGGLNAPQAKLLPLVTDDTVILDFN